MEAQDWQQQIITDDPEYGIEITTESGHLSGEFRSLLRDDPEILEILVTPHHSTEISLRLGLESVDRRSRTEMDLSHAQAAQAGRLLLLPHVRELSRDELLELRGHIDQELVKPERKRLERKRMLRRDYLEYAQEALEWEKTHVAIADEAARFEATVA